ncbi:MAG: type II secretion system protein [Candidatus Pacebacteria bacterium]|nr:type II secretion system protein [Candidatus Paceibacterota bacterium]
MKNFNLKNRGITLAEILISVSIMAVLIAIFVVSSSPVSTLITSRNFERQSELNLIMNAISQNIGDNNGNFVCASGIIPTATTTMASTTYLAGDYNIAPCLIPVYLDSFPYDQSSTSAYWTGTTSNNSAYSIIRNSTTGRVKVFAPYSEGSTTISVTR